MEILRNQNMLTKQDDNLVLAELSNMAMAIQRPQILTEYFSIDANCSMTEPGFKNVEAYISPDSPVMYDRVENLPMSGIDNLVVQSQWNEETGYDEDFQSAGVIYPNTIIPKTGDCFFIKDSKVPALYVVTDTAPVTVRSNPFIEVQIRLFSRDPKVFDQLRRQVKDSFITVVTALGSDKSMVIKREAYFDVQKHIRNYLDICDMYKMLFFNRNLSAFVFDGIYDEENNRRESFIDMTLWRLMFEQGLIIYDSIVTFANNNLDAKIEPIFTSCPDIYVDDYMYKRSILWRLFSKDKKHDPAEFRYPQAFEPDPRVGKFYGKNFIYFEHYGKTCDCNLMCMTCPTWDDEFVTRLKDNIPYKEIPLNSGVCTGCTNFCNGKPVTAYNPYLRNAIIHWYHGESIDWEALQLEDSKTCENYFLIPLLLGAYKAYITGLQK